MMPLTATAATAAPQDEVKASVVRAGTQAGFQGAISSSARHTHIIVAPATYQARRVKEESTTGAQTNSIVKASPDAAMIVAVWWTGTPALTRLLARATPTTPTGHAVHTWRKKNSIGAHDGGRGSAMKYINIRKSVMSASGEWLGAPSSGLIALQSTRKSLRSLEGLLLQA